MRYLTRVESFPLVPGNSKEISEWITAFSVRHPKSSVDSIYFDSGLVTIKYDEDMGDGA